jgi:hypothetical protein
MPDGQSVIIAPDRNTDWLLDGFYQVPIDGGEPRLVVANPFPAGGIDAFSDWQLIDNGSKIVFTARNADNHFEIFVAAIPEPASMLVVPMTLLLCRRRKAAWCSLGNDLSWPPWHKSLLGAENWFAPQSRG